MINLIEISLSDTSPFQSENILALRAPSTTKCDFCQVSFCGIGIPGRCLATSIPSQHLHGLADIGDLIQCGEIYDIFDGNTYEVDVMLDYLQAQGLTPRHIYREVSLSLRLRSGYWFDIGNTIFRL